jgi:hypothetical protein
MVRGLARGLAGPLYGGAPFYDGTHLDFRTGRHYIKAPGQPPQIGPLSSFFTFTGDNLSMYRGQSGLLIPSQTNTPRIEYNFDGSVRGLMGEASRQNICLQSSDFTTTWAPTLLTVGSNVTTAPDGTNTADKLQEDNTNGIHIIQQFINFTSGSTYTFSVWAKAAERGWIFTALPAAAFSVLTSAYFNLATGAVGTTANSPITSVTQYANGWWRFSISKAATATAGGNVPIEIASADNTNSYLGTTGSGIYVWGGQVEVGQFPSSHIPTTTVAVTRAAETCIRTLGSEFSATAGTALVTGYASAGQDAAGQSMLAFDDGTNANRINLIRPAATDTASFRVFVASVAQAALDATFINSAKFKSAAAWQAADFAHAFNGAAPLTSAGGSLPAVTKLQLLGVAGASQGNGNILAFDYWPERKSNAFLQQVSA